MIYFLKKIKRYRDAIQREHYGKKKNDKGEIGNILFKHVFASL